MLKKLFLLILFVGLFGVSWSLVSAETTPTAEGTAIRWLDPNGSNSTGCGASDFPCAFPRVALTHFLEDPVDSMIMYVRPGIYSAAGASNSFQFSIPPNLSIIAVDKNDNPCSSQCGVVFEGFNLDENVGHSATAANITIERITFRTNLNNSTTAIQVVPIEGSPLSLTLNSVAIQDNLSGAGLRVNDEVTAHLNNCTVDNNITTSVSSAAVVVENGGSLFVDGCTFTDNTNSTDDRKTAGAIFSRGTVEIDNSQFLRNVNTANSGGAIESSGVLEVRGSVFESNSAGAGGGAISADCIPACNIAASKLDIRSSNFALNTAGSEGGAIHADEVGSVTLFNVGVTENSADSRGGGVNLEYVSLFVLLNNVDIIDNTLPTDNASLGGGLRIDSAFEILNSTISGNTAADGGGAYLIGVANNTVTKNVILNTTVSNNQSFNGAGGGINLTNNFDNAANALPTDFDNVTFSGNIDLGGQRSSANGSTTGGSGLFVDTNSTLTIRDSSFLGNNVFGLGSSGGGLHVVKGTHSIINTPFVNNSADACGALDNKGIITLINSSLVGNSATGLENGGAICNSGTMTLFNGAIRDNSALQHGGGIYNEGTLTMLGMTVNANSVQRDSLFESHGGGIYNDGTGTLTVANSTISGNSALSNGGGIFNAGNATLNFTTVTNNTADSGDTNAGDGGGIFLASGTFTLTNSILAANDDASSGTFDRFMPDCGVVIGSPLTLTSDGYNVIGYSNCTIDGDTTGNQIGTSINPLDPQLGTLGSNGGDTQTHLPTATSPAADNVTDLTRCAAPFLHLDQRGFTRPAGMGCDSGSVEVAGLPTAVTLTAIGSQQSSITSTILVVFALLTMAGLMVGSATVWNQDRRVGCIG